MRNQVVSHEDRRKARLERRAAERSSSGGPRPTILKFARTRCRKWSASASSIGAGRARCTTSIPASRGVELVNGASHFLDLVLKGRDGMALAIRWNG